jgi:microcystin-dependent protein
MSYKVYFTDNTLHPEPLEIFDSTSNVDTSVTIPGRNQTGYGKIIAENFLHLLENFASDQAPSTSQAVTGQLWYNSVEDKLFVYDGISWKTTSNIRTGVDEPQGAALGDLWVNTSTQQLYLWSGVTWVLVGPQFSEGTKSGPLVENIFDIDNVSRTVIIFYSQDIPVTIISKDSFTPKVVIQGFNSVEAGINITTRTDISEEAVVPKLIGTASAADGLVVAGTTIPSTSFIRTDVIGTIQKQLNVRDDSGLFVGTNGNMNLRVQSANAVLYNSTPGASIDLQSSRTGSFGVPSTVLRVIETKIGINNLNPTQTLDIVGTVNATGNVTFTSETQSTTSTNGSVVISGGVGIAKNLNVAGDLTMTNGTLITKSISPLTSSETIGEANNKYSTIYANKIIANEVEGTLQGNIDGNSNSATSLASATNFKLEGDVSSNVVSFNGTGNLNKTFQTELTSDIISTKPSAGSVGLNDEILFYSRTAGLRKVTRQVFLGDAGVPIGTVLPYSGPDSNVPAGYVLCDGTEYEQYRYRDLYTVIGDTYNDISGKGSLQSTIDSTIQPSFRVPDLRGRFILGKQNMNSGQKIPHPTGQYDAIQDLATSRVDQAEASLLGGYSGDDAYVIEQFNVPDHDHDMKGRTNTNTVSGAQFYAFNETSTAPNDFAPTTQIGGTGISNTRIKAGTVTNGGQKMASSGLVRIANENKRTAGQPDSLVGRPFGVMNPYVTLNYIIRSGLPTV